MRIDENLRQQRQHGAGRCGGHRGRRHDR
jgi:hypothetical protein